MNRKNDSIRFLHLRDHDSQVNGDQVTVITLATGGVTIAYEQIDVDDDNQSSRVIYTFAKCSPLDNFCKRIGRSVCEGRLAKGREGDVHVLSVPRSTPRHEIHNMLKKEYYEHESEWDHNIRRRVY